MEKKCSGTHFILILIIIMTFTASSGCLREFDEEQAQLGINDIEISSDDVKSTYAWFNVTTYIENWGADSKGNSSLMLKVFNQKTGLLEFQQEEDIGHLKKGEAKVISQEISLLKSQNYRIVVTTINDGSIDYSREVKLSGLEGLQTDVQETGIKIEGIDFIARNATSSRVIIENDIYLKNEGLDPTSNYRILVKAREMDAGLIADKAWTDTGEIKPEETIIRSVNLNVPDNYNYVVEVSIWDENTVIMTGEDYLQLNPEEVIDRDEQVRNKKADTNDFVVEDGFNEPVEETADDYTGNDAGTPGFTAPFAVIALIAALYIARRKL